jgi:plasmid replication initiation protein
MTQGKRLIVKKDNALVTAAYTLGLVEQRLVLLAAATAKDNCDPLSGITLRAEQYADAYKVTAQTAYEALKEACETLFERRITLYQADKKTVTRWVSFVTYKEGEGAVELGFSPVVVPLFNNLKERFTVYALEQIAGLTSAHAVRLYELLIQWRSVGKTPVFEIAKFREILGIQPEEYKRMTDFKKRVLDAAIKQVNRFTDIKTAYEQHKQGRSITGFSFSFITKKTDFKAVPANNFGADGKRNRQHITKNQAAKMARPGENYQELYKRLSTNYVIGE